jgi:hypothetical protein
MIALERFVTGCRELGVVFEQCVDVARRVRPALLAR